MKKSIFILITLLLALNLSNLSSQETPPPIEPCQPENWSGGTVVYDGPYYYTHCPSYCSPCCFTFEYYVQRGNSGNGGVNVINITQYWTPTSSCIGTTSCNHEKLMQDAYIGILNINGYPPFWDKPRERGWSSPNNFLIVSSSCWNYFGDEPIDQDDIDRHFGGPPGLRVKNDKNNSPTIQSSSIIFFKGCEETICCFSAIDILWTDEGLVEDVISNIYSWDNYCEAQVAGDCKPACDVLDLNDYFPKYGIIESSENKSSNLTVFPNPTEGNLNLKFNSQETGQGNIKIFTLDGQEVLSESFEKSTFNFDLQFDLSNQIAGHYIIKIYIEGRTYNSIFVNK